MTTWLDKFMEKAKSPAISSPDWFHCIPPNERDVARKLVNDSVPVGVIQMPSGIWKVVFNDTEFTAGAFYELPLAVGFAADWNKSINNTRENRIK